MCNNKNEGLKFDKGKVQYHLVPWAIIKEAEFSYDSRFRALDFNGKIVAENVDVSEVIGRMGNYQTDMTKANIISVIHSFWNLYRHENKLTSFPGLPIHTFSGVARVYEFGKMKYGYLNWTKFEATEEQKNRFFDAFMRHMEAWELDHTSKDEESGINHLEHAHWNLIMLLYLSEK